MDSKEKENNRFYKLRTYWHPAKTNSRVLGVNELAIKIGIKSPHISALENDRETPSASVLESYHNFFGASYDYLMGVTSCPYYDDNIRIVEKTTGLSISTIKGLISLGEIEKETLDCLCTSKVNTTSLLDILLSSLWIYAVNSGLSTITIENPYLDSTQKLDLNESNALLKASTIENLSMILDRVYNSFSMKRVRIQENTIKLLENENKLLQMELDKEIQKQGES